MEHAHVLIRLRAEDRQSDRAEHAHKRDRQRQRLGESNADARSKQGVCRTSETTVRLEHSDMSPGVASITFERVFDQQHSNEDIFAQSLAAPIERVLQGQAITLLATGSPDSGKSWSLHGHEAHGVRGLFALAIERVFELLAGHSGIGKSQVMLCLLHASERQLKAAWTDQVIETRTDTDTEAAMLECAVRVESVEQALDVYFQWRQQVSLDYDSVCVVFVETQQHDQDFVNRGRFLCIDIHGSSIIDPQSGANTSTETTNKHSIFAETHFPIDCALSHSLGEFVGNQSSTVLLVTMRSQALFQQQAIQALLYACKAKDLQSRGSPSRSTEFSSCPQGIEHAEHKSSDAETETLPPPSPATSTSSELSAHSDTLGEDNISPVSMTSGSKKSPENATDARMSPRSERLKMSRVRSLIGTKSPNDVTQHDGNMRKLHAKADQILTGSGSNATIEAMSLLDKLEAICRRSSEMESSLQHETQIKEKCVQRISKLSQTMSFQVGEHEKRVLQLEAEKSTLKGQLSDMQEKYGLAEEMLMALQAEVERMRTSLCPRASVDEEAAAFKDKERALLQQFSSRLEEAMQEAKAVVTHKDGVIARLEMSLKAVQAASAEMEDRLNEDVMRCEEEIRNREEERDALSREVAGLAAKLKEAGEQHARDNDRSNERVRRAEEELAAARRDLQAAHDATANNDVKLGQTEASLADQAQLNSELEAKCAALESTAKTNDEKLKAFENDIASIRSKAAKEKRLFERKLKVLLTERRHLTEQLESNRRESSEEISRLRALLARSERSASAIQPTSACTPQDTDHEAFATQIAALTQQNASLQDSIDTLTRQLAQARAEKDATQQRLQQQMEQIVARQLVEREVEISASYERKIRDLTERHDLELAEREAKFCPAISCTRSLSSSASSASLPSTPCRQRGLDRLPTAVDSSAKKKSKHKRSSKTDDKLIALQHKVEELMHALAVANEQETIAKETIARQQQQHEEQHDELLSQVTQLRHENWNLSLALYVADRPSSSSKP